MSASATDKPVKCCRCGDRPAIKSRQFRSGLWAGQTGWRVFCNNGKHNATTPLRAHKADAVTEWNCLQERAARTDADPAKMVWNRVEGVHEVAEQVRGIKRASNNPTGAVKEADQ